MNCFLFRITLVIFFMVIFQFPMIKSGRRCGPLFLTITADTQRKIIMNWQFTCKNSPDTLILCAAPYSNGCQNVLAEVLSKSTKDAYITKISFGYNNKFPGGWNENDQNPRPGSHCFPYYIISTRNGKKVDENCLKIEPTWMEKFGKLRIHRMLIPGTHNSGSYTSIPIVIKNFILNQDCSLWTQLISGIRFFDLRVGYYEKASPRFWINHDFVPIVPLEPELQHVLRFLRKTSKEIVILHFHRFPTKHFTDGHHQELVQLLEKIFSDLILPWSYSESNLTLEQIWGTGKRLILSYNNEKMLNENDWLWDPIPRKWANKRTVNEMYNYLKHAVHNDSGNDYLNSIMAQQTPNVWTFVKFNSLRKLADIFNPQLNDWLRNEKWDEKINIIAVDFFMSSDIVDIAIEANKKRLRGRCF